MPAYRRWVSRQHPPIASEKQITSADGGGWQLSTTIPPIAIRAKKALHEATTSKKESNNAAKGFPIVAIGASAGGVEVLKKFFNAMPAQSGIAFVVIVHLDPAHISYLPELLGQQTTMPVTQV
ncbi:chemotaxis protein CheB [Candidatus Thiothrix sp. Deng01]|uniref:protein-glutamate methylesterase n=1 Tax=Candidatus Thiothrix phosphatis TaxID=3112415 RepID=A0ABU6CTS6_9GAMM|nr:chemotaxis protein CheB [Candidatus Thiothrix sp. Deng01]MEB4590232.1 chemotaxis protein CheB [Candidatus Thiothrix sp. Deng01]